MSTENNDRDCKDKDFDAVALTRRIRDENYRKYGHLSLKAFAATLSERGEQSRLWKRLDEKRPRSQHTS